MRKRTYPLCLLAVLLLASLPVLAQDYPKDTLIKLTKDTVAYETHDLTTVKGYLAAGKVIKVTTQTRDGWVKAVYKSEKSGKAIPVAIPVSDLKRAKVKRPGTMGMPAQIPGTSQENLISRIPLSSYRPNSATLRAMSTSRGTDFAALNETMGIKLFSDDNLWDDDIKDLARRLDLVLESQTEVQRSYRYYPQAISRLLGTQPFALGLYGTSEHPTFLSILYSNKADQDALPRGLETSMKEDYNIIKKRLVETLGPARSESFEEDGIKVRVRRWDWKNHAVLLAAPEGEYIGVRILPSGVADAELKGIKVRSTTLKKLLTGRVVKWENGDHLLSHIPRVDQGPKKFCVPATWERYLRYMEIPADMYLLALAGDSRAGGGTNIGKMLSRSKNLVKRYGRTLEEVRPTFSIANISAHINKGIPLFWIMDSGEKFNKAVNTYTLERQNTPWEEWKAKMLKNRKDMVKAIKDEHGHACMIVGYNAKTREIAVSDSCGTEFEERWIPLQAAEAASERAVSTRQPVFYSIGW